MTETRFAGARDYQLATHDRFFDLIRNQKKKSPLAVLPTGGGKTYTAAMIAKTYLESYGRRVMFMAHSDTLLDQACGAFREMLPDVRFGFEKQGYSSLPEHRVVFGMVQSIDRRLAKMEKDFGLIIPDECHHTTGDQYTRVLNRLTDDDSYRLGLTATPKRLDKEGLEKHFDSVCCQYDIAWGWRESWLVPLKQRVIHIAGMDLSGVGVVAGDFNKGELSKILTTPAVIEEMAMSVAVAASGRQTLVFCCSIEHSDLFAKYLSRNGVKAVSVHSKTSNVESEIDRFRRADVQALCSVMKLGEGFDVPDAEVVVSARPTMSMSLFTQQVGRVLRPLSGLLPANSTAAGRRELIRQSVKPFAVVIDFTGNMGKHKRLATIGDVLSSDYSDEEYMIANQLAVKINGDVDMSLLLIEARRRMKAYREKMTKNASTSFLRKRQAFENRTHVPVAVAPKAVDESPALRQLSVLADPKTVGFYDVDISHVRPMKSWVPCPFLVLGIDPLNVHLRRKAGLNKIVKTLTDVEILQKARLEESSYSHLDVFSVNVLAEVLHDRFAAGLCSYKQAVFLYKKGYYDAAQWSQEQATAKITAVSGNNYKRPPEDGPIPNYELLIARARRGTESYADGRPDWLKGFEG